MQGGFDTNDALGGSGQERLVVKTDDSIVPCTIKQILNKVKKDDHTFLIDGQPRKQVSLVGRIISHTESEIYIEYLITDGTGTISVQHFVSLTDDQVIPDNTYVFAVGRIQQTADCNISLYTIKRIVDFNQIPFHMMYALFVHLQTTRGAPPDSSFAQVPKRVESYQPPPPAATKEDREDAIKAALIEFLKANNRESGVPSQEIIEHFANQYSAEEVTSAIESCSFNGEIYSTTYDNCYNAC